MTNLWNKLYTRHLLKLLDKICKYEMDPMSIVEYTGQTDGQTDEQGEIVRLVIWDAIAPIMTSS